MKGIHFLYGIILIGLLVAMPLTLKSLSNQQKLNVAYLIDINEDAIEESQWLKKVLNQLPQSKVLNVGKARSRPFNKLPEKSATEERLIETLRRWEYDLFVWVKDNPYNEEVFDVTVFDCKLSLPVTHGSVIYAESHLQHTRSELFKFVRNAWMLKTNGIQSFIFFDNPEPDIHHSDEVWFQNTCYFLSREILSRSNCFAVLPNELRDRFFNHPAVKEGFDIPVKAISFSGIKIHKNAPFNFINIKHLDRYRNVVETSEHLVSKKHVNEFFFDELPRLFDIRRGVDKDRFIIWLNQHLPVFYKSKVFDQAVLMHESLALLDHNLDFDKRSLIRGYSGWFNQELPSVVTNGDWKKYDPEILPEIYRRTGGYIRQVDLAKQIMKTEKLNLEQQAKLAWEVPAKKLLGRISYVIFDGRRHGEEILAKAEEAEEDFLLNYYPQPWVNQINNNWHNRLIEATLSRVDRPFITKIDLDFIHKILTQTIPDHWETSSTLGYWLDYAWKGHGPLKNTFSEEEYNAFLNNLVNSGHEVAALHGGYGMVMLKWKDGQIGSNADLLELKAYIEQLQTRYLATPYLKGIRYSRKNERLYRAIGYIKDAVDKRLHPG